MDYWKNYYNLFDFAILVVSVVHEILLGVELGGSGVTFLRMAAGKILPAYIKCCMHDVGWCAAPTTPQHCGQ